MRLYYVEKRQLMCSYSIIGSMTFLPAREHFPYDSLPHICHFQAVGITE